MSKMHQTRDNFKFDLIENSILQGKYGIPLIKPCEIVPGEIIPFDKALKEKHPENKFIHFYINDFFFDRIWSMPYKYINLFKKFAGVISPDFSMFLNAPNAFNIFQHYKKQTLSHFWQMHGINVISSFGAAGVASYEWCFDGLPYNSIIAISTIGVDKNPFLDAVKELFKRLSPKLLLVYGKNFPELEDLFGKKIIRFESRTEQLRKNLKRSKINSGNIKKL